MENTLLYLDGECFSDLSLNLLNIKNKGVALNELGKFGNCYKFENSHLEIGKIDIANTDFTIDYWIKINNLTSRSYVFGNNNASNEGFRMNIESNVLDFHTTGNGVANKLLEYNLENDFINKWNHIAVVKKNSMIYLYVNGSKVSEGSYIEYVEGETPFKIGQNYDNSTSNAFNGYIDEFRISNVARWESNFEVPSNPCINLTENASLENIVEFLELSKNKNIELKDLLKADLINKGVECKDTDNMPILISKVGMMTLYDFVAGNNYMLYYDPVRKYHSYSSYPDGYNERVAKIIQDHSSYRVSLEVKSYSNTSTTYSMSVIFELLKAGQIVKTKEITHKGDWLTKTLDIVNDVRADTLRVRFKSDRFDAETREFKVGVNINKK